MVALLEVSWTLVGTSPASFQDHTSESLKNRHFRTFSFQQRYNCFFSNLIICKPLPAFPINQ